MGWGRKMSCAQCSNTGVSLEGEKCTRCLYALKYTWRQVELMTAATARKIVREAIENKGVSIAKDGRLTLIRAATPRKRPPAPPVRRRRRKRLPPPPPPGKK